MPADSPTRLQAADALSTVAERAGTTPDEVIALDVLERYFAALESRDAARQLQERIAVSLARIEAREAGLSGISGHLRALTEPRVYSVILAILAGFLGDRWLPPAPVPDAEIPILEAP